MKDKNRCGWSGNDPLYTKYHDEEWGKLVMDDKNLFEFLVLESAQAGLSWITILRKRENYRKAFSNYDLKKIAKFNQDDVENLLQNDGIIRNRMKIEATINNAQKFMEVQNEFGSFSKYLNTFMPNEKPIINKWKELGQIPIKTELSDKISKDMKKRGFKFFGSTTCYAYLQAIGYINDHLIGCDFR